MTHVTVANEIKMNFIYSESKQNINEAVKFTVFRRMSNFKKVQLEKTFHTYQHNCNLMRRILTVKYFILF